MRLYKRHQTWWIEYQRNREQVRFSTHTRERAIAEQVLASIRLAVSGSVPRGVVRTILEAVYGSDEPAATRHPLEDAWNEYSLIAGAVGADKVDERTIAHRRGRLARFIAWTRRSWPAAEHVESVDGVCAASYAADLARSGLAEKTRVMHIADLSLVWSLLEKLSPEIRNPWKGLRPRVTSEIVRHPFTPDEERAVMAAAEAAGHGWRLACLVARHTGLRYGDVATLEWPDVDLARGVIALKPRKTARHGVRVSIPIERHSLLPALAEASASKRDGEMGRYVLPEHATYYQMSGHSKMPVQFADVLRAAGVNSRTHTFHSWRHTLASRMGDAGIGAETRKLILGHTTDEMAERYDHADHLAEQADAIAAASGA